MGLGVVLIDDSEADNFYHKYVIKQTGLASIITDFVSATDALSFFRENGAENVDLMFVDLNLPAVNGFEFVDKLVELGIPRDQIPTLVILTNSLNPADEARALKQSTVKRFVVKPLTEDIFREIVQVHTSHV